MSSKEEITLQEFYQIVNTLLYRAHEKIPTSLIPKDGYLVSDLNYHYAIKGILNPIVAHMSKYYPKFEFQPSPFDKEKIVPAVSFFETSRMYAYRKPFQLDKLIQILGLD